MEPNETEDDEVVGFDAGLFSDEEDSDNSGRAGSASLDHETMSSILAIPDLDQVMKQIREPHSDGDDDFRERTRLVQVYMGSMTLCRGERGERLREAGAIDALLCTLAEVFNGISNVVKDSSSSINDEAILVLASTCFGAIRDLACGSAANRSAVRTFVWADDKATTTGGLEIVSRYLGLYDGLSWNVIASSSHLKLLTNVIGALRNLTHSTPENCAEIHNHNVTSMLIWRLRNGYDNNNTSLPDPSLPWREGAFRAAGTLINMAEKCPECAVQCARDAGLIQILIESWGGGTGTRAPLLHLGLAAILHAARDELPSEEYDPTWTDILVQEQDRKRAAQRREQERKQRQVHVNDKV